MKDIEAERQAFRQNIDGYLAGGYNAEGIERWWLRPRTALAGKTPSEILAREDFDPADALSQEVLQLAQSLQSGNFT